MTLRRLTFEELTTLYGERIVYDFPPKERRSLTSMEKLYRNGRYVCLGLEQKGTLIAYAAFISDPSVRSVLLDYFAVEQQRRGTGIGSVFLGLLGEYWIDMSGIIIECEAPESADNEKEKALRDRRVTFYIRGGARVSDLAGRLFGVDYRILWLPVLTEYSAAQIKQDMLSLYTFAVPALVRRLFIKLKIDEKSDLGNKSNESASAINDDSMKKR